MRTLLFSALLACFMAGGCNNNSEPATALATIQLTLGGKVFHIEVASTDKTRARGLMFREKMADDHGMLFAFPDEIHREFWMKNTVLPLDIIYLKADGTIDSIRQMQPYDLRTTPSNGPAQYAIELNQGTAARLGLKEGDKISLPASVGKAQN